MTPWASVSPYFRRTSRAIGAGTGRGCRPAILYGDARRLSRSSIRKASAAVLKSWKVPTVGSLNFLTASCSLGKDRRQAACDPRSKHPGYAELTHDPFDSGDNKPIPERSGRSAWLPPASASGSSWRNCSTASCSRHFCGIIWGSRRHRHCPGFVQHLTPKVSSPVPPRVGKVSRSPKKI